MGKELRRGQRPIREAFGYVSEKVNRAQGLNILRRLIRYSEKVYDRKQMMESLRDGRVSPQIKTPMVLVMLWARMGSLNALEETQQMRFWKWLDTKVASADTIGRVYTNLRVDLLRKALHGQYSKLKRNKAIKTLEGLMKEQEPQKGEYRKRQCLWWDLEVGMGWIVQCEWCDVHLRRPKGLFGWDTRAGTYRILGSTSW